MKCIEYIKSLYCKCQSIQSSIKNFVLNKIVIQFLNKFFKDIKGFALIEIAIVLFIIGLLVTGVVSGKHLINLAKIRSLITDLQEVQTKVSTFENMHNYKPGDFPTASSLWGTELCGGTQTDGYNGDGDGLIAFSVLPAAAGIRDESVESYMAWCHLYTSGLGPETHPVATINTIPIAGDTLPKAKLGGVMHFATTETAAPSAGFGNSQNLILIGNPSSDMKRPNGLISPADAYILLNKYAGANFKNNTIHVVDGNDGSGGANGECTKPEGEGGEGEANDLQQNNNNKGCIIAYAIQ